MPALGLTTQHGQRTRQRSLILVHRRPLVQQLDAKLHTRGLDGRPYILGLVYIYSLASWLLTTSLCRQLRGGPQPGLSQTLCELVKLVQGAIPIMWCLRPHEKYQNTLPWLDMLLNARRVHVCL